MYWLFVIQNSYLYILYLQFFCFNANIASQKPYSMWWVKNLVIHFDAFLSFSDQKNVSPAACLLFVPLFNHNEFYKVIEWNFQYYFLILLCAKSKLNDLWGETVVSVMLHKGNGFLPQAQNLNPHIHMQPNVVDL